MIEAKKLVKRMAKRYGIAKGKNESKNEIATQMLRRKYSINEIISITGVSKKEIENLIKENRLA